MANTNASEMVRILEDFLKSNAGIKEVAVDGVTVVYDRAQALTELAMWRSNVSVASGTRPLYRGFNLGNAW